MPDHISPHSGAAMDAVFTEFVRLQNQGRGWITDMDRGDLTTAGEGSTFTVKAGVITLSKMANLASGTILGRVSGGSGSPEALTATQMTSMLNSFNSTLKGLAPASGGGTINYLRADGTWAAPPGAGVVGVTDGDKGDVVVSSSGSAWTVDAGVITLSKMANLASGTILGRTSAGSGSPEALTPTQLTAMLNTFTPTIKGLVPPSDGALDLFLRSDGQWVTVGSVTPPSGGGSTPNPNAAAISAAYKTLVDVCTTCSGGAFTEHMRVMALVTTSGLDKVAVQSGGWFDPNTWHPSGVPTENQKCGIPVGITVTYDEVSTVLLKTVRVDGILTFSKTLPTRMNVDTMVINLGGRLEIGTSAQPCTALCEILFPPGNIDTTTFDPFLFSKGVISHGDISVHGVVKTPFVKISNVSAGATQVSASSSTSGWAVGDEIIITGTRKKGWIPESNPPYLDVYIPTEDERVTITNIAGSVITFTPALAFPHVAPSLRAPRAINLTRNIRFESPNGLPVHQRGHTMFMHSDDVDVRYASFKNLGRTDKSQAAADIGTFSTITPTTNTKGRYPVHIHKTGTLIQNLPTIIEGCVVDGTAGWGYAHHSSHAKFSKCISWDCFGAGFAAEDGDETGIWEDCIAVRGQGYSRGHSAIKPNDDLNRHDNGRTGDGFFFAGRLVNVKRCVAINTTNGFVWMSRSAPTFPLVSNFEHPEIGYGAISIGVEFPSIQGFADNEAWGNSIGFVVIKNSDDQNHDIRSLFPNFVAWEVDKGAHLEYTGHYTMSNWHLTGAGHVIGVDGGGSLGVEVGSNAHDLVFKNCHVQGFYQGFWTNEAFTHAIDDADYLRIFIDQTFADIFELDYSGFSPARHTVMSSSSLVLGRLTWTRTNQSVECVLGANYRVEGNKTDTIGTVPRSSADDGLLLNWNTMIARFANVTGYWLRGSKPVLLFPDLISDRAATIPYLPVVTEVTINSTESAFKANSAVAGFGGGTFLGTLP